MRITVAGFHVLCRDPAPTLVVLDAEVIAVLRHVCCRFWSSFHTSPPFSLVMVLVLAQS